MSHNLANLNSEVLKVLEDKRAMMHTPPPFPQSAQYKKEDEVEPEEGEPETGKPRKKSTRKSEEGQKARFLPKCTRQSLWPRFQMQLLQSFCRLHQRRPTALADMQS